jgi:hypothetical protein
MVEKLASITQKSKISFLVQRAKKALFMAFFIFSAWTKRTFLGFDDTLTTRAIWAIQCTPASTTFYA